MLLIQQTIYSWEGSINKFIVDDKGLLVLCVFGAAVLCCGVYDAMQACRPSSTMTTRSAPCVLRVRLLRPFPPSLLTSRPRALSASQPVPLPIRTVLLMRDRPGLLRRGRLD